MIIDLFYDKIRVDSIYEAENTIEKITKAKDLFSDFMVIEWGLNAFDFVPYGFWIIYGVQKALNYEGYAEDFIKSHSRINEQWNTWRNANLTGEFYCRFKFNDDIIQLIYEELDKAIKELETYICEETKKREKAKQEWESEHSLLLDGVDWKMSEKTIYDEGGETKEITHRFVIEDDVIVMTERNIFDFGRVVNYKNGAIFNRNGVMVVEKIEGDSIPLTINEKKAHTIICRYSPLRKEGIRM